MPYPGPGPGEIGTPSALAEAKKRAVRVSVLRGALCAAAFTTREHVADDRAGPSPRVAAQGRIRRHLQPRAPAVRGGRDHLAGTRCGAPTARHPAECRSLAHPRR